MALAMSNSSDFSRIISNNHERMENYKVLYYNEILPAGFGHYYDWKSFSIDRFSVSIELDKQRFDFV